MTTPVEIEWAYTALYWPKGFGAAPYDREQSPTFETVIYAGEDGDGYCIALRSEQEVNELIDRLVAARDAAFPRG